MYEIIYWLIYYQMGKNPVFSFGTYRLELHYLQRMTLYRKFNGSVISFHSLFSPSCNCKIV